MKRYIALFLAVAFGVTILAVPLSAHNYSANWPRMDREYNTVAEPQGDDVGWIDPHRDGGNPPSLLPIDLLQMSMPCGVTIIWLFFMEPPVNEDQPNSQKEAGTTDAANNRITSPQ